MENNYTYTQEMDKKQGSYVTGFIGALLAAAVSAVLWAVIGAVTERVYTIVGVGVGFLVCKGYDLFKGRQGAVGAVIVALCVVLALVAGTIGFEVWFIHDDYQSVKAEMDDVLANGTDIQIAEWYFAGEPEMLADFNASAPVTQKLFITRLKSESESLIYTEAEYFQLYLEDPEYIDQVVENCGSSLLFGLLGSFGLIIGQGKKKKEDAAAVTEPANDAPEASADDAAE